MNPQSNHRHAAGLCQARLLLALLCGPAPVTAQALASDDWQFELFADSLSYSETVPIAAWFDELDGPTRRGERAFTSQRLTSGLRHGPWLAQLSSRYDTYLQFNPDTFEAAYRNENDLGLVSGQQYPIALQGEHLRGNALSFGYVGQWQQLEWRLVAGYLRANEMFDGSMSGVVSDDGERYQGQAHLDWVYSEDLLLDRAVSAPTGHGLQSDLWLDWRPATGWHLWLHLDDLFTQLWWRDIAYTQAELDPPASANPDLFDDPLLSGVEGYRDYRQRLPLKIDAGLRAPLWRTMSGGMRLRVVDQQLLPELSLHHPLGHWQFGLSYLLQADAPGLVIGHRYLALQLASDSLDWQQARTLVVNLALQLPL